MDSASNMLSPFAKYVMTVDMFPVFFFAHFIIANILIREDSKHLGPRFPQKHPFASWLCTLLCALSGAFLDNFLFGKPLLAVLSESFLIGYFTIIWYLMNFSPYDIVYKVVKHPTVIIPASILQECLRVRFLYLGMQTAADVYPNAPLIILTSGILRGNGYGFIKIVERLVRGHWNPKTNELLEVSYFAKSGMIASVLFLLHHYKILNVPIELLYLSILVASIIGRLVLKIGGMSNPLAPLEVPFCRLVFGSWDDTPHQKESEAKIERDNNKNNNKKKPGSVNENGNAKKNGSKKSD